MCKRDAKDQRQIKQKIWNYKHYIKRNYFTLWAVKEYFLLWVQRKTTLHLGMVKTILIFTEKNDFTFRVCIDKWL